MTNSNSSAIKNIIRIILISSAILMPVIFLSGLYWVASKQEESSSRFLTQHFDPKNSAFFLSTMDGNDSWAIMLASDEFSNSSQNKQEILAKVTAEEAWKLVGKDQGYNKSELDSWFLNTAKNYKNYPIKKANLTNNQAINYRDLSSTPLPKPNRHIAVLRAFSSESLPTILQMLFWLSLCVVIGLSILIGTIGVFTSKQIPGFFKIIVFALVVVVLFEAWLIQAINKQNTRIIGESFFVFEYGDYVSAKGTWRGVSEKIAYPSNAAKIECYKDQGVCRETNANVDNNFLMIDTAAWDIKSWDEKEIIAEQVNDCSTVKIIINYKDKAVTQMRTPKDPLPENCVIGGTKFITELANGIDIAFPRKTQ